MKFSAGRAWKLTGLWLAILGIAQVMGCATSSYKPQMPFSSLMHRSAKIPQDASKEEIVAYVNRHTEPIKCWQSSDVQLKVTGSPIPLGATIAVQEPNLFRLRVSGILGGQNELDLGSNPEQIWFWAHRMEPRAVITCRHEEIEAVQAHLPVPFQPDWLMEVLCVRPLDCSCSDMIRNPENPKIVKLVSHHENELGQAVRKVSTIDLQRGEITGHQLFDSNHQLIVSAELSDYRAFPNTTARLPHSIKLHWTQQDMKMELSLRSVQINPPQMRQENWEIPQIAGSPVHELRREHLMQPATGIASRTLRDKPKTITEYELDQPSGVWMQNQQRVPPDPQAAGVASLNSAPSPVAPSQSPATSPAAGSSPATDSPYFQPQDLAAYSQSNPGVIPVGMTGSPPPFPDFADSTPVEQTAMPAPGIYPAVNKSAGADEAGRKSRESLIDGIPASEFEPPVKRSVTN